MSDTGSPHGVLRGGKEVDFSSVPCVSVFSALYPGPQHSLFPPTPGLLKGLSRLLSHLLSLPLEILPKEAVLGFLLH